MLTAAAKGFAYAKTPKTFCFRISATSLGADWKFTGPEAHPGTGALAETEFEVEF
jgi:hypothetical protein